MACEYMGTSKAAELWNCRRDSISKLCRDRKIKGAEQDGKGKPWRISVNAPNPFVKQGGR